MSNPVSEYEDLKEYMVMELPQVPAGMWLQQLQMAGRELCEDTEAWVDYLPSVDITEDDTTYNLNTGWDASIQRIILVKYGEDISETSDNGILDESQYDFNGDRTLTLTFDPAEDITDGLLVEAVLRPNISHTDLPEWFMERWAGAIMAKCFMNLMSMENKPWTSASGYAKYKVKYQKSKNQAFMEKFISYKRGGTKIEARKW